MQLRLFMPERWIAERRAFGVPAFAGMTSRKRKGPDSMGVGVDSGGFKETDIPRCGLP